MEPDTFIPGLALAEAYYHEAVKPILDAHFTNLKYSAALIGFGSDVLGFDTPQSMDHMWGPRLLLFLRPAEAEELREPIRETLAAHLPLTFHGFSTNFSAPDEAGIQKMVPAESGPVRHMVRTGTIAQFFGRTLGVDPSSSIAASDWLTFSEQRLLSVTSGRVFRDDLGLEEARARFAYYPRVVWLYLLACQWVKIAQEEAFVGRCGDIGDELGSRIIAARLVQYLIRLAFLMEQRYAPYSKWLGTAFARLECGAKLSPIFGQVLAAGTWREREAHLSQAYEFLAKQHNALAITRQVKTQVSQYYDRPYLVIHAYELANEIFQAIGDEKLRSLPPIGSVDQFSDSTDILSNTEMSRRLQGLYQ